MKTTFEERIQAAADKAHALSHKALKNPVSSILSLCVLGICAATLITFSQTNDAPVTQEAATAENVIPVGRTLTSADGRTIDVVITAKTATGIKAKKADGKEFEISLDKLSDADKAFIAGLVAPPVKKLNVLVLDNSKHVLELLKNYKFEMVVMPHTTTPGFSGTSCDISAITPDELSKYDIIWNDTVPIAQREQWRALLKKYNGVVCEYFPAVTTKAQWLDDRHPKLLKSKPFVKEDKNFIFFSPYEISKEGSVVGDANTMIYKEVIDLALKLRE